MAIANNKEDFIIGALVGSAIGVAAAFLLSQNGGALRKQMQSSFNRGLKHINDMATGTRTAIRRTTFTSTSRKRKKPHTTARRKIEFSSHK